MVPLKVLTILRYSAAHELCDNPGSKKCYSPVSQFYKTFAVAWG